MWRSAGNEATGPGPTWLALPFIVPSRSLATNVRRPRDPTGRRYMTAMPVSNNPTKCGDYYCDANNVCGEYCTEMDVQEANNRGMCGVGWHIFFVACHDPLSSPVF